MLNEKIKTKDERYKSIASVAGVQKNTESNIRAIHYLGSKLRLLEVIKSVIDEVDESKGTVCDLFAGSGTVSKYLSTERNIISVDIQEYSRVLCSALLNPSISKYKNDEFIQKCKSSKHRFNLNSCFSELIKYEIESTSRASNGDLEPICDLLENGSIITYELGDKEEMSFELRHILNNTIIKMEELNYDKDSSAIITRYFGGLYFSYEQAIEIDSILEEVFKLDLKCRDTYLAALLSTTSEIVNTVGKQFAQPLKPRNSLGIPKKNLLSRLNKDRSIDVFGAFEKWLEVYTNQEIVEAKHEVCKADYSDALDSLDKNVKVVYADPPYTRYHYSRYYHVLETMCLRDNPKLSTNFVHGQKKISRGVYRQERHQSPFSIKTQSHEAFRVMFEKVSKIGATLVLSYSPFDEHDKNSPRVLTIEKLVSMAKKYFTYVEVVSAGDFSHSKLNNNDKNFEKTYNAELLIICTEKRRGDN